MSLYAGFHIHDGRRRPAAQDDIEVPRDSAKTHHPPAPDPNGVMSAIDAHLHDLRVRYLGRVAEVGATRERIRACDCSGTVKL